MRVNYFSVKGKRKVNEDYILSKPLGMNNSIHIIADGMGGYDNGRLAAETVANTIFEYLLNCKIDNNSDELIKKSLTKANTAIKHITVETGKSLGSTIGGCLLENNKATLFWVGDVKLLHVRDNKIRFESEDHSLINQLKKNGSIDNGLDLDSIRHIVTKSIKGEESNFMPETVEIEMAPSDKIIICSDGILEISKIVEIAKTNFNSKFELDFYKNKFENNSDNSSLIAIEF